MNLTEILKSNGIADDVIGKITEEMKEAAARAIADVIPEEELTADYVLPDPFNPKVVEYVAKAVMDVWNSEN